ncbi:AP-1 complex subunit beta-1 isoform X2, partial [Tachysurus ichikawai]
RQVFLATWKDIPTDGETQFQIKDCHLSADAVSNKLQGSNVFTVARRTADGQELLYLSVKFTNGIWVLAELRVQSGNPNHMLSVRCRAPEVSQHIYQSFELILHN